MKLDIEDQVLLHDLQQYLRINTAHPDPDYEQAMLFLQSLADRDGFQHTSILLPSGLSVLVISYVGLNSALPALALNHHMDVVPVANEEQWESGAFSGVITNDARIIGRGTQDMKGVGMVHYHALRALKRSGLVLERSIHILCVPDEEKGGLEGVRQLVDLEAFYKLNIGYVIDEGCPSGDSKKLYIKIDERKPLQIRICTVGQAAHGSSLMADNPNHRLVEFLHHIVARHKEQQMLAEIIPAGLLLSAHITSISSGFSNDLGVVNVVPEVAYASVDIRIPPSKKMQDIKDFLDILCLEYPQVSYEITAAADERSEAPDCSILFDSLSLATQKYGLDVLPLYFEAASDMRHYHKAGIQGVGFTPFTSEDNLHGTNEWITVAELIEGKNIMSNFLNAFCYVRES